MKKIVLGALAAALLCSCREAPDRGDDALAVCQFNMRCDVLNDGHQLKRIENGKEVVKLDGTQKWEMRAPLIKKFLRYHEVDVCGSQELFKNQIEDMRDLEDAYGIFGTTTMPSRDKVGHKNHNNVIFYKKSRLELLETGVFWFSDTPEKESLGWGAKYARNCNWGKFRDKKTGKIFFVFSMHFHHIGENVQYESARLLVKKVAEITQGAPFFAMGDLNSNPDSRAVKEIKSSGFMLDAAEICETPIYGPDFTDNYGYTGRKMEWIDWVFVPKGVSVEKFAVFSECFGGVWPSDHFPLLLRARIR
ncbi:MAG: endonuclease/exonuclease/phosphatase family protein [Opitutales bacterium]|nr:endonuclease/exonuclease/phosphatase family protein [Opitutales bacterium]